MRNITAVEFIGKKAVGEAKLFVESKLSGREEVEVDRRTVDADINAINTVDSNAVISSPEQMLLFEAGAKKGSRLVDIDGIKSFYFLPESPKKQGQLFVFGVEDGTEIKTEKIYKAHLNMPEPIDRSRARFTPQQMLEEHGVTTNGKDYFLAGKLVVDPEILEQISLSLNFHTIEKRYSAISTLGIWQDAVGRDFLKLIESLTNNPNANQPQAQETYIFAAFPAKSTFLVDLMKDLGAKKVHEIIANNKRLRLEDVQKIATLTAFMLPLSEAIKLGREVVPQLREESAKRKESRNKRLQEMQERQKVIAKRLVELEKKTGMEFR